MRLLALALVIGQLGVAACGSSHSSHGTVDASMCSPSCGSGTICCSEPTHMQPPTAYRCVAPAGNGTCPLLP